MIMIAACRFVWATAIVDLSGRDDRLFADLAFTVALGLSLVILSDVGLNIGPEIARLRFG